MKITRTYEVWTGGDLVDDWLTRDEAITIARKELKDANGVDVVVDEIIHYEMHNNEDLEQLKKEI